MKISQEEKKRLIESGKFNEYRQKRKHYNEIVNGDCTDEEALARVTDENGILSPFSPEGFTQAEHYTCERIRNNATRQTKKIEDHVSFLMNQQNTDLYFMTFTFNEDVLNNTTKYTRKQKVRRLLRPCNDYILNIDYGSETEREHYHAIISLNSGTYTKTGKGRKTKIDLFDGYDYGFYSAEPINSADKDCKKISRYITKLTLHSVKVAQQYVSVKKGTSYQRWKKNNDRIRAVSRADERDHILRRQADLYREQETLLENGEQVQNLQNLFGSGFIIN